MLSPRQCLLHRTTTFYLTNIITIQYSHLISRHSLMFTLLDKVSLFKSPNLKLNMLPGLTLPQKMHVVLLRWKPSQTEIPLGYLRLLYTLCCAVFAWATVLGLKAVMQRYSVSYDSRSFTLALLNVRSVHLSQISNDSIARFLGISTTRQPRIHAFDYKQMYADVRCRLQTLQRRYDVRGVVSFL